MLTYLIILLDKTSASYCHYHAPKEEPQLMPIGVLKKGVVWAMKENVNVQFVYPDFALPGEYDELIESIDHTKIKPESVADSETDVVVLTDWKEHISERAEGMTCVIRASRQELMEHESQVKLLLGRVARLNVILTDTETLKKGDVDNYKALLERLSDSIVSGFANGRSVQLNLLTDRLQLSEMNNCGAGDTTLTLAPNGRFYICPAFYYEDAERNSVGDLSIGVEIENSQLLRLDHAPICRVCDAFHCHRCVWMNVCLTGDVNTPSHEQCVVSHLERNASRRLQQQLSERGIKLEGWVEIPERDYLDPFEMAIKRM